MKVLLVESVSAPSRLHPTLSTSGHEVITTTDSEKICELIKTQTPVLTIIDSMTCLSAVQLCKTIRDSNGIPEVYILVLAPNGNQHDAAELIEAGADDFLKKPFDESELDLKLRAAERMITALHRETDERKRIEMQLRETQLRYKALLEHLPAVTYIAEFGVEGTWVYVSPQIEAILGYTTSEWIGTLGIRTDRLDPRDRERVLREEAISHLTGNSFQSEYRMLARDGRVVWLHDEAIVIKDENGNPLFLQGIISDICKRKEMEEALRENQKWLQTVSQLSPVGIFRTDSEGNCLYVNQRWCELAGLSAHQAAGKGWAEALHPEDRDRVISGWARAVEEKRAYSDEFRFRRADGTSTWLLGLSVAVTDDTGDVIGYIGTITDISDRKERELRLRAFAGSIDEIVFEFDEAGTYLNIWTTNETLLVYPSAQLIGHRLEEFFPPEFTQIFIERFQRVLRTGQAETMEYTLDVMAGKRWFQSRISPVPASDGSYKTVCLSARDVTDLKFLQEQLLQSQKIETVGRLAGGIAHDFNNLLMAISGYCELIGIKYQFDSALLQHVKEIEKAAEHGAALTHQLLAFSRKQVLASKVLNLNELILRMQTMIERLIGEHIHLHVHLEPDLATIKGDSGQIEQVIMNLVVNARDAMPDGGRLTIETGNTEFTADTVKQYSGLSEGRYVHLFITDTGTGMDEETKSRIFEPFFTTKGLGKGTGLGLATVYGIIRQSGGDIMVLSEAGKGSTFSVYLPSTTDTALEVEISEDRMPDVYGGNECILLVDDNDKVRTAIASSLELYGYSVLQAVDGDQALQRSRDYAGAIEVLVTDVVMPHVGGRELARYLKVERPDIKIVFMSGYTEEAGFIEQGLTGDQLFLQKPATVASVLQTIRKLLDHSPKPT